MLMGSLMTEKKEKRILSTFSEYIPVSSIIWVDSYGVKNDILP